MRRRTFVKSTGVVALGAISAAALASCGGGSSNNTSDSDTETSSSSASSSGAPLRVALVPWIGWRQTHIAEVKGFFEEEGVTVEQTVFQTVSEANTALLSNQVDMAWLVAADLVVLADKAPDLKFILASDYSGDVDAIVARNISGPEELKGKKLAREDVPYEVVFVGTYLQSVGLTPDDVEIVPLTVPDGTAAMIAGNVDAVATYEPFLSKALDTEGSSLLFSAKGTNIIANGLCGHGSALDSRRDDILAYIRALNKGLAFTEENPDEANEITADWVGISAEEVADLMTKIDLLDLDANKTIAFASDNDLNIINSINTAGPILVEAGKAPEALEGETLVDSSFVEAL